MASAHHGLPVDMLSEGMWCSGASSPALAEAAHTHRLSTSTLPPDNTTPTRRMPSRPLDRFDRAAACRSPILSCDRGSWGRRLRRGHSRASTLSLQVTTETAARYGTPILTTETAAEGSMTIFMRIHTRRIAATISSSLTTKTCTGQFRRCEPQLHLETLPMCGIHNRSQSSAHEQQHYTHIFDIIADDWPSQLPHTCQQTIGNCVWVCLLYHHSRPAPPKTSPAAATFGHVAPALNTKEPGHSA